jgi:predicted nucleotidyltransferase
MAERSDFSIVKAKALKFAKLVKKNMQVKQIYLFGSYAKKSNHIDSDIDIAVVSDDFSKNHMDNMLKLMRLRREIDAMIEPHPFLSKDFKKTNSLVNEIIKTGIRLI